MRPLLIFLHVGVCLVLIVVILLQAGRGANMGAMFGGASQTVFGAAGAGTFLTKMTAVVAILFMLTTLGLAYLGQNRTSSVVRDYAPPVERTIPVAPAPAPTPAPAPEANPTAGN